MRNFITIALSLTTLLCLGCSPEAQNNTTTGRPPMPPRPTKADAPTINPEAPPINPEATEVPEATEDTSTPEASEASEVSTTIKPFKIGDKVPELKSITYLQGPEATLADPANQTIHLIDFWATWCGPCRTSVPTLSALQKKYPELRVIAITKEEANIVKPFIEKNAANMTYTIAIATDPDNYTYDPFIDGYGELYINRAFLVDATGTLLWWGPPTDPTLTTKLETLMPTTSS